MIDIRKNEDGSLDEVVATDCGFHLEQMDDGYWWIGITLQDGSTYHINISLKAFVEKAGDAKEANHG